MGRDLNPVAGASGAPSLRQRECYGEGREDREGQDPVR